MFLALNVALPAAMIEELTNSERTLNKVMYGTETCSLLLPNHVRQMVVRGAGSISSPIVISDDEDEAVVESQLKAVDSDSSLLAEADDLEEATPPDVNPPYEGLSPNVRDVHTSSSVAKTVGYSMALRMGFRPGHGLGLQLDGRVEPLSPGLKRKRTDTGIGFQGKSQSSEQGCEDSTKKGEAREDHKKRKEEPPVPPPKAKLLNQNISLPPKPAKARKATAAKGKGKQPASGSQHPSKPPGIPTGSEAPPDPSYSPMGGVPSGSTVPYPTPPYPPLSSQTQRLNPGFNSFPACFPLNASGLPEPWQMPYWLGYAGSSYVPWQESTSTIPNDFVTQLDHTSSTSSTQRLPPGPGPSASTKDMPSQPPKNEAPGAFSVMKSIPKRPKLNLIIGRGREADLQNTHGTYKTHFPNQPDPSRTLVLDSIPQRYRTVTWVTNWAVNAGQANPIQVDVDIKKGKGLIEFPDASSALKAFSSRQLRGKGKQAVRAWWYRVPVLASKRVVGEIEEGEIEEEAGVKPRMRKQKRRLKSQNAVAGPTHSVHATGGNESAPAKDDPPYVASMNPPTVGTEQSMDDSLEKTLCQMLDIPWKSTVLVGTDPVATVDDDNMTIASSRPPSIRCVTPPQNDSEDMVMSSPVGIPEATPRPPIMPLLHMSKLLNSSEGPHEEATNGDKLPPPTSATLHKGPDLPLVPQADHTSTPPTNRPQSTPTPTSVDSGPPHSIPSEPRSFKNPPLAPTFAKRSLLARQKELEDKIAQSKVSLNMAQNKPTLSPTSSSPSTSSSSRSTPSTLQSHSSLDRVAMEQDLRRLVLESKKNKQTKSNATHPLVPPSVPAPVSTPTPAPVPNGSSVPPLVTPTISTLEELAVSFIAESIETASQPVLKPVISNTRHELALKQERLERYIAESKSLMAKLSRASSKVEKENILSAMRECTRMMELDSTMGVAVRSTMFCWPSSHEETVLEISDDEGES
ncbi:hypothetical protein HYDPIDRAFT_31189 [Hydnomerulius pinastri MD-312]|uniref:G-patch domain-containing protein n=1 Tax=Hydnomerulius pinastri MD-312 TaxID=994086 RepID=A0A0C9V7E2_9AGAM|nr:hypothetical protein HYDPIDRAFT_31189 [Hydnomerulius pinastri MD-312]